MLLGIIITFLVIWFLLLLGETIIWSDRFMWIYAEVFMMCLSALVLIFSFLFL